MKLALAVAAALAFSGGAIAQTPPPHAHGEHAAAAAAPVEGIGFVRAINAKKATVIIAHEAIPALNWGAMTMSFKVPNPALLKDLKVGAKVKFQLEGEQIVALTVL